MTDVVDTHTISLDHAATTPLRPEARAAIVDAWDAGLGNASGTHGSAQRAKNAMEAAREQAAELLGVTRPLDVIFTSGGTESDNLAVHGVATSDRPGSVVVSAIEHKAVLEAAGALDAGMHDVLVAPADRDGLVPVDAVTDLVDDATILVSVMAANNEIGTILPIRHIADAVRPAAPDALVHTDAVQAFVGGPVDVEELGVDLLTLSAHKFGGPQGVGILVAGPRASVAPMMRGGGQEAGRRPGTSNVPGIVGMVAAMAATSADRERFADIVGGERESFERVLIEGVPDVRVTGARAPRVPHVSHVLVPDVLAETLLIRLDRHGLHAAAGSSCQSGALEPSHVLTAIGLTAVEARQCVRFSFGWDTPAGTGASAARLVAEVVAEIRR